MNLYQTNTHSTAESTCALTKCTPVSSTKAEKNCCILNLKTRQPEKLFEHLQPYGSEIIVGVESTFNWYWLCDACEEKKVPLILIGQRHFRERQGASRR